MSDKESKRRRLAPDGFDANGHPFDFSHHYSCILYPGDEIEPIFVVDQYHTLHHQQSDDWVFDNVFVNLKLIIASLEVFGFTFPHFNPITLEARFRSWLKQ